MTVLGGPVDLGGANGAYEWKAWLIPGRKNEAEREGQARLDSKCAKKIPPRPKPPSLTLPSLLLTTSPLNFPRFEFLRQRTRIGPRAQIPDCPLAHSLSPRSVSSSPRQLWWHVGSLVYARATERCYFRITSLSGFSTRFRTSSFPSPDLTVQPLCRLDDKICSSISQLSSTFGSRLAGLLSRFPTFFRLFSFLSSLDSMLLSPLSLLLLATPGLCSHFGVTPSFSSSHLTERAAISALNLNITIPTNRWTRWGDGGYGWALPEKDRNAWIPVDKVRGVNLGGLFIMEPVSSVHLVQLQKSAESHPIVACRRQWMAKDSWNSMGCSGFDSEWECNEARGMDEMQWKWENHW